MPGAGTFAVERRVSAETGYGVQRGTQRGRATDLFEHKLVDLCVCEPLFREKGALWLRVAVPDGEEGAGVGGLVGEHWRT